jgi:D-alanyl-D-alanine carboxypeptidase (penicillin-binding protein 5/6)
MELVAVVMGCETSKDRFAACKSLLDFGFANYCLLTPPTEDWSVPVTLGKEAAVTAVPGQTPQLLLEKAQKPSVTTQVELEQQVAAPVSKGQRLGTLTVRAGEQILSQIPLVADRAVEKRTFGDLFWDLIRQLCGGKS